MSELDTVLRDSLSRLAEPGDPHGVAEAVRMRVEAVASSGGDGSAASGMQGGAGGASGGFWGGWVPFALLAVAGAGGGAALALTLPGESEAVSEPPALITLEASSYIAAAACPGGAPVIELEPGARVLVLNRSDDGAFVAVRDPGALGHVVWVATDLTIIDQGLDLDDLSVDGCDHGSSVTAMPSPSASIDPSPSASPEPSPGEPEASPQPTTPKPTTPAPGPTTPAPTTPAPTTPAPTTPAPTTPAPPADITPPAIVAGTWDEPYLCHANKDIGPLSAKIFFTATDNVAVTAVTAASGTNGVSVSGASRSGSTYTFTVTFTGATGQPWFTVIATARDAAGNTAQASAHQLQAYSTCVG